MSAKVVETARLRPGKCAITGDTTGPFLDTGKNVPRFGRVYLSVRGLTDSLRDFGFLAPDESESIREDNERLQDEVRRLTAIEDDYRTLIDAVAPHIEVEPQVIVEKDTKVRAPNDEEIEAWIKERGGAHPAVVAARPLEKGSPEEWRALYGDTPPGHPQFSKPPTAGRESTQPQELANRDAQEVIEVGSHTNVVTIHDQEVDLNKVLDQKIDDVLDWAEGHDDDVHESLYHAEYTLAKEKNRDPRKGVIEGLGYEYVTPEEYEDLHVADVPEGPEVVRDQTTTSVDGDNVQVDEPVIITDDEDEDEEE